MLFIVSSIRSSLFCSAVLGAFGNTQELIRSGGIEVGIDGFLGLGQMWGDIDLFCTFEALMV